MLQKIIQTDNSKTTLIIRLMVGAVFLSEGIQKFLFPGELGVGRFIKIGIPMPEFFAPFVGGVEIFCGTFILLGLTTRLMSMPLIIDMVVAIISTKIPVLIEDGLWSMAHEARTDWSMLLANIFLLIKGSGNFSIDHKLKRKHE